MDIGGIPRIWDQSLASPLPTKNTINTERTLKYIHAPSWIRTHNTRIQTTEESICFMPCGHCGQESTYVHITNEQET
jgi:hypothetical protein